MTTTKENKHNEYYIPWRLHFYWTVAIICFILAKLWWLVPLPGAEVLPVYRTYAANFLNTICLTVACALATRSIVVGLVKSFQAGIYPESIIKFGETGGFAAMWSCIRYRSGVRYFLIAMLVTACTLLSNALESELQHSVQVYYKLGSVTSLDTAQCQHATQNDYLLASAAYSSGLVTNTISDASPLINTLNATQPMKSFSVSVIKTALTPIQNISTAKLAAPINNNAAATSSNTNIFRRHYSSTTSTIVSKARQIDPCVDNNNNNSSSTSTNKNNGNSTITSTSEYSNWANATASSNNSGLNSTTVSDPSSLINGFNSTSTGINNSSSSSNSNGTSENGINNYFNLSSLIASTSATAFTASNLTVIKNIDMTNSNLTTLLLPYQAGQVYNTTTQSLVKLDVYRYTDTNNQEVVIIYSPLSDGVEAGVYVSATATKYTCQSRDGSTTLNSNVICDNGVSDNSSINTTSIAEAMVTAMLSGDGLYGTALSGGLAMDITNGVNTTGSTSKLVDALFANPLCSSPELLPSQGQDLYGYSAGRMTNLAILWLVLFFLMWLIGVYLIGYSQDTWIELTSSGVLVSQIISKSPNMFEEDLLGTKTVKRDMYLNPEEGKMNFREIAHPEAGYSVTTVEMNG